MAKVMESLHTAQYQYIPALALPENEQLNLKLNNPPSFHKPQSVLVVALPPVKPAALPVLSQLTKSRCTVHRIHRLPWRRMARRWSLRLKSRMVSLSMFRTRQGKSVDLP